MIIVRVRRLLGIFIFLVALTFLLWGIWPFEKIARTGTAIFPKTPTSSTTRTSQTIAPPGIPEALRFTLELPVKIRVGDAEVIRLSLEVDENGNLLPAAPIGNDEIYSEHMEVPNLYDNYNRMAEARLDLVGIQALPSGELSQPLRPGQRTAFFWSLRPSDFGNFQGAIWLHLRYISLDDGGESRRLLSNQLVEIEAVNLLGLGGTPARVLGGVGIVVGSFLALEKVFSWFCKLFQMLMARKPAD